MNAKLTELAVGAARGKVVKGRLSLKDPPPALGWCTRRLVDHARRRALAMALTGDQVDAQTALEWGLVDELA